MENYRFRGAAPFDHASLYFGRDKDIDNIYNALVTRPLTVLASPSGSGKTSLINAGIIPKIVQDNDKTNIIKVRFNHHQSEKSNYTPLDNVIQAIESYCRISNFSINETFTSLSLEEESVYYSLKKFHSLTQDFYIIIDQFEELFSYPKEEQFRFAKSIGEVVSRVAPLRYRLLYEKYIQSDNVKENSTDVDEMIRECDLHILFSLRSDKLHGLSYLSKHFSDIFSSVINLTEIGYKQSRSIITNTSKVRGDYDSPPFKFDQDSIDKVINYLTSDGNSSVDLTQLQIICRSIESTLINYPDDEIVVVDSYNLPDLRNVVENFYIEVLASIPQKKRLKARQFIVKNLIQNSQRVSVDELACLELIDENILRILLDKRLITSYSNRFDRVSYEISHDTLLSPILKYESEIRQGNTINKLNQSLINLEESRKVDHKKRVKAEESLKNSVQLLSSLVPNGTLKLWEYFFKQGVKLVERSNYKKAAEQFLYSKLSYDLPKGSISKIDDYIDKCNKASILNSNAVKLFRDYRFSDAREKYISILSLFESDVIQHRIWHCENPSLRSKYFVKIEGGKFEIGDSNHSDNKQSEVILSNFKMGRFQVTNAQFSEFMNIYGYDIINDGEFKGKNIVAPEWFGISNNNGIWKPSNPEFSNHPIIRVTWYGAREFCKFWKGDLPSESQWEFASRSGGKQIKYSWGNEEPSMDNIKQLGHIAIPELHKKSAETTSFEKGYDDGYVTPVSVGAYTANNLGLYNLTGNVWEWCLDTYAKDSYNDFSSRVDPVNSDSGQLKKVIRGGSCYTLPHRCSNYFRNYGSAGDRYYYTGFRVVI